MGGKGRPIDRGGAGMSSQASCLGPAGCGGWREGAAGGGGAPGERERGVNDGGGGAGERERERAL